MTNVFFNVRISSEDSSFLERLSNASFAPVRYLFKGRLVEILDQKVIFDRQSFPNHHWVQTALTIALLVPFALIGTVIKLSSLCIYASSRKNFTVARDYFQNRFNPPKLLPEEIIPLSDSHQKLERKSSELMRRMTSEAIWDDQAFIKDVNEFMFDAYKEVEIFYHQLKEKYNNDLDQMVERISLNNDVYGKYPDDKISYMFIYFYDSLTEMYHLARSRAYLGNDYWEFSAELKPEHQKPYFNPQMNQYQWRILYNAFCQKLDDSGLSKKLKDDRFKAWSQPDFTFVNRYGFPGTRPTKGMTVYR